MYCKHFTFSRRELPGGYSFSSIHWTFWGIYTIFLYYFVLPSCSLKLFWWPGIRPPSLPLFVCKLFTFSSFLQNCWANFNQTWHKTSLGKGDLSTCISKLRGGRVIIFFSKTTEPISTKLGTKHHWMKGIFFFKGDNKGIVKIYWQYLKIFFYRTICPISTKLATKHLWVHEGNSTSSKYGPFNSQ